MSERRSLLELSCPERKFVSWTRREWGFIPSDMNKTYLSSLPLNSRIIKPNVADCPNPCEFSINIFTNFILKSSRRFKFYFSLLTLWNIIIIIFSSLNKLPCFSSHYDVFLAALNLLLPLGIKS